MSAKYKSPSFLLPNELNTSANTANDTGVNSLYSMDVDSTKKISNITGLGLGTSVDTFSISLWFYKSNMDYAIVFSAYSGSGNYFQTGVAIELNLNGTIMFWNGDARTTTSAQYSANTWYNLVVTSDGTTVKMYVNGSQVTLDSTTAQARNFTNVWINGASYAASNFGITGKIDEVAIFNRALDSTEIAALYDGTGSNIRPSNLIASNLNPIAYYPLGEQAQNTGYLTQEITNGWQFPNGVLQDYVMDFGSSVGKFINLPNEISLSGEFAISFWLKPTANNINLLGNSNNTNYVYINPSNQVGISSSDIAQTFSSTIISSTSGNWQNLLITRDSSNVFRTYVNGDIANTVTDAGTFSFNQIGRYYNVSTNDYRGEMSNVAIWNSDQSANIADIYNNGSPQTSYTVSPQNWWKLNATSVYTPSAPNYTKALDFNGSSDYIDAGNPADLQITGALTLSAWIKTINTSTTPGMIIGKDTLAPSQERCFAMYRYLSKARFFISKSGSLSTVESTSAINDGNWHHIVAINDGTDLKMYVDGVLEETNSGGGGTIDNGNSPFNIGRRVGSITSNNNWFNGSISNVASFNSALTASQVSTLFNFGTPETNISFNPVAWWKLDDQTAITDSSGNGNTGTNNGATNATTSVAVVPSWKIPSALTIPTINYTTALDFNRSEYDNLNTTPVTDFDTGDVSFSVWVFKDDSSTNGFVC